MSTRTQTWCDICQADEQCDESRACGLEGNDGDHWGTPHWVNGYGPMDIDSLVWEHGWCVFTRMRHVPEQRYPPRDGREEVVISAYDITDVLEVCARCLADPEVRDNLPYVGPNSSLWVLKPHVHRNQENYDKAVKATEAA